MNPREELARFCQKAYAKEFVAATDGNLSLRLPSGTVLITPGGRCKGELQPEDMVELTLSGEVVSGGGKPSTESKIHLLFYSRRADVNAVVHCHPVYATAFAVAGQPLEKPILPEVVLTLGKVPLCRYATPSTDELPASMLPYIHWANALLLQNHGAVTVGASVAEAYYRMEKLEHTAKIIHAARQLGRELPIPAHKVEELHAIAKSVYGISSIPGNNTR